ncbi:MAG: peptidoglycan glycosyltransferase [Lachnospiraceae bacterium]|nr:peptidoglycan glycosyltransferase [Lachnospiraceae bacterium]
MAREINDSFNKLTGKMKRKLTISFFVIVALLIGLFARIIYINQVDGPNYSKKVLSQQSYSDSVLAFKRGSILDTNGNILATSEETFNIVLDCYVINHKGEKNLETVIDTITDCVNDVSRSEIKKMLEDTPDRRYGVLRKDLDYNAIKSLEKALDEDKAGKISGVWLEKGYKRVYPNNTLASSFLGFTSAGNVGTGGIEGEYNDVLNGSNGRMFGYLTSDNNFQKDIINPEDGKSVVTTIDVNIQRIVDKKIEQFNNEHANVGREGPGSKNTGVIIMNPNNGEILAMADYPNFDLNKPRDLSAFFTEEQIKAMTEEQQLEQLNKIWNNYCISQTFEPGSTTKVFTVAAGLETGKLSGNETYMCDGVEVIAGQQIHCVNRSGHGVETVEDAISDSCNDALMQMAAQMGNDAYLKYQDIFNLGLRTTIDLPGEASTAGLVFNKDNMKPINLATSSFGQGYNATMIQIASAYCSIINGGYYYRPHCVKRILNSQGETVQTIQPTVLKETISERTQKKLMQYMHTTVETGTAKLAHVQGYSMGGKTGTAQKLPRDAGTYVVSLAAYAPAENPQVFIYTVIDEPNDGKQDQARFASELSKSILEEVLPYMNIYPDQIQE